MVSNSLTLIDSEVGGSGEFLRLERVHAGYDSDTRDFALRLVRLLRRELERRARRVALPSDGVAAAPLAGLIDLMLRDFPASCQTFCIIINARGKYYRVVHLVGLG